MENKFQDYYDVLSYNLEFYKGEYAPFIDYGPELLHCYDFDDMCYRI